MAASWTQAGTIKGAKGDPGQAGRAFLLYSGTATAGGTIANPNSVGLRGGKADDTLVDQNGDMFYITSFSDTACKLGSKVGSLKGPAGPAGPTTAATTTMIGAVKPGAGLRVDSSGKLGVNVGDGLTVTDDNNIGMSLAGSVENVKFGSLVDASDTYGGLGVPVGTGLTSEPLNVGGKQVGYQLAAAIASATQAGVVKPGTGLTIAADGTLTATGGQDGQPGADGKDGTQVKVVNATDTLPTGLPAGSVVIQVGTDKLTFYTEDGKTA